MRPTQITVGLREVETKRRQWRDRPRDAAGRFLGGHMIPAVIGPKGQPWIVDHHHLALAMLQEGVEEVMISVLARLDDLPKKRFMAFMDAHNWLHPYDEDGKRREFSDLPRHIRDLVDDPYRSLAGEVRRAGGYAKSPTPYTEFLWADFFRDRIKSGKLENDFGDALSHALPLARSQDARHLPGWAGPDSTD
ncbi:putative ParB-like nuclease [Novosphingobium nitrogenifigens DSM 19370]|uniref:Putative ParB-like nuclease n=1 Tax=Novosphingobium nitrogenifigens DSM 19370 TaxID=983920 RepID=F1ZCF2_9SPHN|nr:putative ParB-like nuclease [Novosphingobium nitrogenifigens DSM 19370]